MPERTVLDKEARIDTAVTALEEATANKDWEAIQEHASQAARAMDSLANMGAAAPTLTSMREQPKVDELRSQLKAARNWLWEAQKASWAKDGERLETAMEKFRQSYGPVRAAARK